MDLGTFCAGLPVREISSQADLEQYLLSDTFQRFYAFVKALSESVVGLKLSDCPTPSANVHWAATLLEQMSTAVSNYPPIETNSRFGNAAFRDWLDAVRVTVPKEHFDKKIPLSDEVSSYLLNSLGDYQRIDYGTGHEAHFIAWLYCLCASETGPFFSIQEHCSLVLSLFIRYMRLMRLLQQTYWLEPAGSHGVWGLDDYHFLPFLFGASQLINHPHLRPKSIHDSDLVEEYVSEYLYFECIDTINRIKTATLQWHSPMLNDISAVRTWSKVNQGLLKMYRVEVLGKVPIMQHFLFGKIIPFHSTAPRTDAKHRHSMRGDCCGNPLPSIYSAAGTNRSDCSHNPLSKLPFD